MDFLFLHHAIRTEIFFFLFFAIATLAIAASYGYSFVSLVIEIFGPKKRDARLHLRDQQFAKKLEEKSEDKKGSTPLPPAIQLEELSNVAAVDVSHIESRILPEKVQNILQIQNKEEVVGEQQAAANIPSESTLLSQEISGDIQKEAPGEHPSFREASGGEEVLADLSEPLSQKDPLNILQDTTPSTALSKQETWSESLKKMVASTTSFLSETFSRNEKKHEISLEESLQENQAPLDTALGETSPSKEALLGKELEMGEPQEALQEREADKNEKRSATQEESEEGSHEEEVPSTIIEEEKSAEASGEEEIPVGPSDTCTEEVPADTRSEENKNEATLLPEVSTLLAEASKNEEEALQTLPQPLPEEEIQVGPSDTRTKEEKSAEVSREEEIQVDPSDVRIEEVPTDTFAEKEKEHTILENNEEVCFIPETRVLGKNKEASSEREKNKEGRQIETETSQGKNQEEGKQAGTEESHLEIFIEKIAQIKTLIARERFSEARTLIIEGLSVDKEQKDLNLLLGEMYERERRFSQAEIIYKDLAHLHPNSSEVLQRLANILIIRKNYTVAFELYKKVLSLGGDDEEALFILANVARQLNDIDSLYTYTTMYLKKWPSNKDMLTLLSEAQITLEKRKEAIQTLIKLKNLSPYDAADISALIQKLSAEEELAQNFNPEP